MNIDIIGRFALGVGLAFVACPCSTFAYDNEVTHPNLTMVATEKSALYTDPTLMFRLGLAPADQQFFNYRGRVGPILSGAFTYPLSGLIGEGAFDEDRGRRAINHFYDPYLDRTLTILGVPFGNRSWRWMLEDLGPIANQDRSIADARGYIARAITFNEGSAAESEQERGTAWGTLLLSLGSAMHHMQDMHQPQHVRNDDHLEQYPMLGLNPFFNPSRYEFYTAKVDRAIAGLAASGAPVYPGTSDFQSIRDFWFNSAGTGSAQYTNRSFVSQGTNFTMRSGVANTGTYPLPLPGTAVDFTVEELHAEEGQPVPAAITSLCGNPAIDCTMAMYPAGPSTRASTLSIFDQDLRARGVYVTYNDGDITPTYQTDRLFALNRFNFNDAHKTLIGRAVGYSAGLVNHFFRGKLEVSPPTTGAYAVVDHSTGQGFTTVRATVKNATSGAALQSGTLQAIARFHRNNCYQADLSGEWTADDAGQPVPPCPDYRSAEEHLRLTAPESVAFGDGEEKQFTFTFSDPIPMDATDLVLQVFYRGTVGSEPESFAVGAADLSEPTFATVMNGTDVFEIPTGSGGQFFYYQDIIANVARAPYSIVDINGDQVYASPPDVDVRGGDIRYDISVDGKKVGEVAALPPGRFLRIAALVKPGGFNLRLNATGGGFGGTSTYSFAAKLAQIDTTANAYVVSVVNKLRSQTLHFDSVTYWHYYPTSSAKIETMLPSRDANASTPVAVTMTPP